VNARWNKDLLNLALVILRQKLTLICSAIFPGSHNHLISLREGRQAMTEVNSLGMLDELQKRYGNQSSFLQHEIASFEAEIARILDAIRIWK